MEHDTQPPSLIENLPPYEINRFVIIKSKRVAIIYYSLLFVLVGYSLIGFYFSKQYLEYSELRGTVSVSLSGAGYSENKIMQDSIDLRYPGQELDAIFIITTKSAIYGQTKSNNTSSKSCNSSIPCKSNEDCKTNDKNNNGSGSLGLLTGTCSSENLCTMISWCPNIFPKQDQIPELDKQLTLSLRTDVYFPDFDLKTHNNLSYTLASILEAANITYNDVYEKGAVLLFSFYMDCTVENISDCPVQIDVKRLDKGTSESNKEGFEMVYAHYGQYDDKKYRDLIKATGIRIVFLINGRLGKLSFVKILLGIGSTIGLAGLASSIMQFLVQNVLEEGKKYASKISVDIKEENEELKNMCEKIIKERFAGKMVESKTFAAIRGVQNVSEDERLNTDNNGGSDVDGWD